MGSTSSRDLVSDETTGDKKAHQAIFPDTVVQRFSFYGVIACLFLSIATFLWVATNANKWNQRAQTLGIVSPVQSGTASSGQMFIYPLGNGNSMLDVTRK